MTHRAHRPPATVPARRGMRAAWFRGRATHELDGEAGAGVPPPPADAGVPDPTSEPSEPEPCPAPAATAAVPSARPGFGHPTF